MLVNTRYIKQYPETEFRYVNNINYVHYLFISNGNGNSLKN